MKKERKKRLRRIAEKRAERRKERTRENKTGIFHMTRGGFGFVTPDEAPAVAEGTAQSQSTAADDVFIPAKYVRSAMDGDQVRIELLKPTPDHPADKGPAGKVIEILRRGRDEVVGEIIAGHKIRPLNRNIPEDIELSGSLNGAKRGDWVRVKLLHSAADSDENRRAVVRETLGRAGSVKADLDAVMAEFNLCPVYTEEENRAAAAIVPREIAREDVRDCFTLTIDPFDAKDFDDAISLAPGPDSETVVVGVHIADVAAFITPGSDFDRKASARGFSCYLPGRTLPMLPRDLTAKISLQEGVDSPAHSVFLTVERATGKILSSRRVHTLIRVRHRLNYDEVQEFIDNGGKREGWDAELLAGVRDFVAVTGAMREFRKRTEEFIDLEIPECRVLCDENADEVKGLVRKMQRQADRVVEECMLAANSLVAVETVEKNIPGIFRVHPEPDPEKMDDFAQNMQNSFHLNPGLLTTRAAFAHFIASLPDDPRKPVILSTLLRSLARAYYLETPAIHFGLGKGRYSHFTSPIRRYTDLVLHQQLWNADTNARMKSKITMGKIALECSEKEEVNDEAYYAASDRLKLRYLEESVASDPAAGIVYEGVIAKIISAGLLVDIASLGLYGFVPAERLGYNPRRVGDRLTVRHGEEYKCGDYIYLHLSHVDHIRGSAVFTPARQA